MVAVVLADPPAVAQPDAQVAKQDAEDVVGLTGAEDLTVPGIVTQEADLGEHTGQEHGVCHHESPSMTNPAHPPASSTMVRVIFQV